MKFKIRPHFFEKRYLQLFLKHYDFGSRVHTAWKVSKYGVISDRIQKNTNQKQPRIWTLFTQYQDRARLYRWQIVVMGPQSSPSPPFAILLLFLRITFDRNGWNETFSINSILDFVNPNGIFFYIYFCPK